MKHISLMIPVMVLCICLAACNDHASQTKPAPENKAASLAIKEEAITYDDHGVTLNGFVAYDSGSNVKRPAVLVVHEWWGLNDYSRYRARELAKLGYIALALDFFGNGKVADNPDDAMKYSLPFYKDPAMAKSRVDAGIRKIKEFPVTDTGKIAAIGYCFGGAMVLNVARLGDDLKGVVSFHGSLVGTPARKDLLKSKVLVCNGADDTFIKPEEIARFKKQMDSIGADYTFKSYPGAIHAFTNPNSTEVGKKFNLHIAYQPAADTASWNDMQAFFNRVFK